MDKLNTPIFLGIILFLLLVMVLVVALLCKRIRRFRMQAVNDAVTKGLNSFGFYQQAGKCFSAQDALYAVVVLQLRNYQQIMQTFGCEQADRVLGYLQHVLKQNLSSAEPVGRIEGGVFCLLLKNCKEDKVNARLTRIYESANQYNAKAAVPYVLDLGFGVYFPKDRTEPLQQMYEKAAGALDSAEGKRCGFYKEPAGETASRKWELIQQMDRSLKGGDFVVYLQPKVRLSDNRIVSAEALIRWRHPQRGMLNPEMFIPMLEEYHLVARYDLHLFELVCRQMAQWAKAGLAPCPVSVNLSHESVGAAHFMEDYAALAMRYGVNPELIEFELGNAIQNKTVDEIAALLGEIHRYGFKCALDNFGAGALALHLLRELDVDTVKLDRSFFASENNNRRNRFVVEGLIKVAAQMQIHTVAEGIDNASQVQYLKQAGCDMVQGYYYFLPMAAEEFRNTAYQDGQLRYVEEDTSRSGKIDMTTAHHSPSSIVMFTIRPHEDTVTFSHLFTPLLDGRFVVNGAQALFQHATLIHENDRKDFFHLLDRCLKENGWVENMIRFYTANGRYEWLEVHLHKEQTSNGKIVIFGTLVNVAGWKNEVDRWKEKANRDALTGLYNREYFEQYASSVMEKGTLLSGAIVFFDIDDFKKVNDTLGHMVGDDVICYVAKRALGAFRHTDIVARYGGDEFVIFVNGINREELRKRLSQLCDSFRFPYRNGAIEYPVAVSIGAAVYPQDGRSYLELLDHADCATYEAKHRGKNQFVIYEPGMGENADQ